MKITSEKEMIELGISIAKQIHAPQVIELVGDVGAGKTTFVRGLAKGLGVKGPVTSPSFTISKSYAFPGGILTHYDFYRLPDPGLMAEDLEESMSDPQSIVIVEWANTVENLLPENCMRIEIKYNDDNTREVNL